MQFEVPEANTFEVPAYASWLGPVDEQPFERVSDNEPMEGPAGDPPFERAGNDPPFERVRE